MNVEYVKRALCFHGPPMQKIWDDERSADDLHKLGVPQRPDFSVYQERQKYFTFQDRAKRLKMHQFFARKAQELYDLKLTPTDSGATTRTAEQLEKAQAHIAVLPPYEVFLDKQQDKVQRWRCVLEGISPGDVLYGVVMKVNVAKGMIIKPLCTKEPVVRYLGDMPTKAFVHYPNVPAALLNQQLTAQNERSFNVNDFVCCEVLEVSVDADRLMLGMEGAICKRTDVKFGIVDAKDLPAYYRVANENASLKYEDCLRKSLEFANPNFDELLAISGLDASMNFSFLSCLKNGFAKNQYADQLRLAQAGKWAMNSVAEGIEYFKQGKHNEAFQLLNKALQIDPANVEGLVARGALYANKGSFKRAVDDFDRALKINPSHANARKYMGETLVALGRSYEEDDCIAEAKQAYNDCLKIIPNHEQAMQLLQRLQRPAMLPMTTMPPTAYMTSAMPYMPQHALPTALHQTNFESFKNAANDSSSDSNDSSESPSSARQRVASLSPLSQRMALHAAELKMQQQAQQATAAGFDPSFFNAGATTMLPGMAHEFRLDEDDTESRVQQLLSAANKYKKKKSKKSKKKFDKTDKKSMGLNFMADNFSASSATYDNSATANFMDNFFMHNRKQIDLLEQSTSSAATKNKTTSIPFHLMDLEHNRRANKDNKNLPAAYKIKTRESPPTSATQAKLSFQIKRPVTLDKLGMVRIASPVEEQNKKNHVSSPARSRRSRSRSRYRHRSSHSRSRSRHCHRSRRSRTRSRSTYRRRRRSTRTRSRSRSRSSSASRRHGRHGRRSVEFRRMYGNRRTPSPFVPRDTPPLRRRRTRSTSRKSEQTSKSRSRSKSKSSLSAKARKRARAKARARERRTAMFGNKVWSRPGYTPAATAERWLHDKYSGDEDDAKKMVADDGPTIEEIDELINKQQKERKEEIIRRDKDILKKTNDSK